MKTLKILFVLALIGIIAYLWFFRKPIYYPIPDTHYITDTFWVKSPYVIPEKYVDTVPPRTVIIYEIDSLALDSLKILLTEKDILIQGLKSEIKISQAYLKQFPSNPKLISLDLSRDTLSFAALHINGHVIKNCYPINLVESEYRWTLEGLSKIKSKPIPSYRYTIRYWVGTGVNLLYVSPYFDLTAEKDWARIRLYSDIKIGLFNKNASSMVLGIKYRIHGKNL